MVFRAKAGGAAGDTKIIITLRFQSKNNPAMKRTEKAPPLICAL